MIREDLKQLKTGPRDLRKFGLLVGGVLTILGLLYCWRGKPVYPYLLAPGLALMLLGAVLPRTLKYIYIGWMAMAFALGFVISHVILTLFFFLVITPIGLVARLAGKDFLHRKLNRNGASYWVPRQRKPSTRAEYEQQF